MEFKSCTVIIPVIRETELFERVVSLTLESCAVSDLKEFIIVVHPEYTSKESITSIEKMRPVSEAAGVAYQVLEQKLPGMGGAMRDALEVAKGSHTIIQNADMALDPRVMAKMIACAKDTPATIISASRYIEKGSIEEGYKKLNLLWNRLAQVYCAILYQSRLTDFTYAYRCCPTVYYHAVQWEELKHPFALEGTLKFVRLGLPFREIPGRQIGGSQSGYRETLLYLPVSLHVRFMRKKDILKPDMSLMEQRPSLEEVSI